MKMNYASHMTTVYKMWEEMGYTFASLDQLPGLA